MKIIIPLLLLVFCACTTPLKPQPAGTQEVSGSQGDMKYVVTKVGQAAPICTLLYMHGVDEDQNAVRSSKYPHDELVPMARKLGCAILVPSYGSVWLMGADIQPSGLCKFTGGCRLAPSLDKFLSDLALVMNKHGLSSRVYAEGVSQGGFNLSSLAMKKPEMFTKVLIAHPVMKYNDGALEDLLILTNFTFLKWFQVNPVNVIARTSKMPATYVSSCKADTMVPTDAAQRFCKIMKDKGLDCTLHIDKVGCSHGAFESAPAIAWMTK